MTTPALQFDVIVIGSGPGGYKAALAAAHQGAKVALVEKSLPGGTCLNQGCVPKKALLHLAGLLEDVQQLQGRGILGEIKSDFRAALAHRDQVVAGIRETFPLWLRRLGIQVFAGAARFEDAHTVIVAGADGEQKLLTHRSIIATGAAPREHPACPTDGRQIINSRDFMFELDTLPATVLCVGGGAIGTELGFLMHQFGARITIVDEAPRLLNRPCLPDRASNSLERKFQRLGVEVRKDVSVAQARKTSAGVDITFTDGTQGHYERVLVAIGRTPSCDRLGLAGIGVRMTDDGFIHTNEFLETSVPGIYAVGDVKPGPMTANAALHDAKIAATNVIHGNQARANYFRVPIVIDSALEIAAVGLSEEQADAAGFEPEVARASFGASAKARGRHDYEGFIEVVHDGETGQLLGGCIVGPEAGEQIHLLAAACQSERGLWFFTDMNYSHPSWTEELENAIDPHAFAFSKSGKAIFEPGIFSRNR